MWQRAAQADEDLARVGPPPARCRAKTGVRSADESSHTCGAAPLGNRVPLPRVAERLRRGGEAVRRRRGVCTRLSRRPRDRDHVRECSALGAGVRQGASGRVRERPETVRCAALLVPRSSKLAEDRREADLPDQLLTAASEGAVVDRDLPLKRFRLSRPLRIAKTSQWRCLGIRASARVRPLNDRPNVLVFLNDVVAVVLLYHGFGFGDDVARAHGEAPGVDADRFVLRPRDEYLL